MNDTKMIPVMESVYERNAKLAVEFNQKLTDRNIFCVNVMGAPGVGKTLALTQIIKRLNAPAYVVEGDIASDIDTQKLQALGIPAAQVNTGGACHLDAPVVAEAFTDGEFSNGFLFVENIGNLVCPAEFMIGEHIKVLISAVTEGSDKPYKYPLAFEKADIVLLNKIDLLGSKVDFDMEFFLDGIQKLNPAAPVCPVSSKTGKGVDRAVQWILNKAASVIM